MELLLKADNKTVVFVNDSTTINVNDDFVQYVAVSTEAPLTDREELFISFDNKVNRTHVLPLLPIDGMYKTDIPDGVINEGGTWMFQILRRRYNLDKTKWADTASYEYELSIGDGVRTDNGELITTAMLTTLYKAITEAYVDINLENGEGTDSIVQKATDNTRQAKALGYGAVAFGGYRGDKENGIPDAIPDDDETTEVILDIDTTSIAKGIQSTVLGAGNRAYGNWDLIAGKDNKTFQKGAFAIGGKNSVGYHKYNDSYLFAGAIGELNNVLGRDSLAIGSKNKISVYGEKSIAIGEENDVIHGHSAAVGFGNKVYSNSNYALGYCLKVGKENAKNGLEGQTAVGCYNAVKDETGVDATLFIVGNGTSDTDRSNAFEVLKDGRAKAYGKPKDPEDIVRLEDITGIDSANTEKGVGNGAVQQVPDGVEDGFDFTGKNPNATVYDPTLTGTIPYGATGAYASSFGGKSSAQGKRSHAEGTTTIAKGNYSHAEGDNSVAIGNDSHAEGYTTVTGKDAIAAHAEGHTTQALGRASHSEGQETIASGDMSHAEGYKSASSGAYSHAENNATTAQGKYSHAQGSWTKAEGDYSHSEGSNTHAYGAASHVGGTTSYAGGENSFAHGENVRVYHKNQAAFGQYNENNVNSLFEIGCGTSHENRKNAFSVEKDGTVKVNGQPLQGGGTKLYAHTIYGEEYGEYTTTQYSVSFICSHEEFKNKYELVQYLIEKGFDGGGKMKKLLCTGVITSMGQPISGFVLSRIYANANGLYVDIASAEYGMSSYAISNISVFSAVEV